MQPRTDFYTASPDAMKAMLALEAAVGKLSIELPLLELIRLRVSQINGCAFCLDMHTADARKGGETERRLYTLSAWRETPFFTPRERAALAWAESLTLLSQTHAPDADFTAFAADLETQFVPVQQALSDIDLLNQWTKPIGSAVFALPPGVSPPVRAIPIGRFAEGAGLTLLIDGAVMPLPDRLGWEHG